MMVLIWIGIAVGIILTAALIYKTIKSSKNSFVSLKCKKCGFKTNGLKCPICESEKRY
jgi:rubrerythrin